MKITVESTARAGAGNTLRVGPCGVLLIVASTTVPIALCVRKHAFTPNQSHMLYEPDVGPEAPMDTGSCYVGHLPPTQTC